MKGALVAKKSTKTKEVAMDRRAGGERREVDRRKETQPIGVERRKAPRRNANRRRQIDPTTCERDYTEDEIEFMQAMDAYKRSSGRMFPTCSEILEVVRALGYERKPKQELTEASADNVAAGGEGPIESASAVTDVPSIDMISPDDLDDEADFEEDDFDD
jgi:hypothetical protein